jgi:hypothetical protein
MIIFQRKIAENDKTRGEFTVLYKLNCQRTFITTVLKNLGYCGERHFMYIVRHGRHTIPEYGRTGVHINIAITSEQ